MSDNHLPVEVLDRYYRSGWDDSYKREHDGYQVRRLTCSLCSHQIDLADVPKQTPFGDSNLGKVARLRGAMRKHLRERHVLEIAVLEQKETKR